jgi:hypothetical protein
MSAWVKAATNARGLAFIVAQSLISEKLPTV